MRKDRRERDDFPYINETIVREHRRRQIKSLFRLVGSAVLFGCVAGACILVIQRFRPRETPVLAVDTRTVSETTEAETTEQAVPKPVSALAGYDKVRNSFLTVSTVYGSGDWLDQEASVVGTAETFGLVIAEDSDKYYILTAADRMAAAEEIYVEIEGQQITAEEEESDRIDNISLISVWKEDLPEGVSFEIVLLGATVPLQEGDTVIAAGSPYSYVGSVNYGHVVYRYQKESYDCEQQIICTDMTADANGQGVLLNTNGEAVAWISASGTGNAAGSQPGLISGILMEDLEMVIRAMVAGEPAAFLGIQGSRITEETALEHGIPTGLYLTAIAENSPAREAGIQPGDIITSLDGQPAETNSQVWEFLLGMDSGDSVTLTLKRMVQESYEEMEVEVVLEER